MRLRSVITTTALVAAALTPGSLGTAQASEDGPRAFLKHPGVSAQVQHVLETDDTARLDPQGGLYYVDPAPERPAGLRTTAGSSTDDRTVSAAETIPTLHSRAGSTHKIYLDFDGYTTPAGNEWSDNGSHSIPVGRVTGPFSLDGDPTFSLTEVAFITKVWKIVSEKFSPWDVDVTTEFTAKDKYERDSASDVEYGTHVVITSSTGAGSAHNDVCNQQCAGIAYSNVNGGSPFSQLFNTNFEPAWVFASKTFGSAQLTAHDAAHEIGHTMGLGHDGNAAHPDYYEGQANWVPIMGLTNQKAVAQWSKGEYSGANNTEDDLAIIGSNGDARTTNSLSIADDYPNSGSSPAPLTSAMSYAADGIISNAADSDVFTIIGTCASGPTVTATSIDTARQSGQTLDIKLDILNASNVQVASSNPASGQDTSTQADGDVGYTPTGVNATVSPGAAAEYRIRVTGSGNTGAGTVATTGYTSYGSIGRYHLTVAGCTAGGSIPPTAPTNVSASPNDRTTTANVTWTAPSDDGDGISGYKFTGVPGNQTAAAGATSKTLTGLTPGTTYTVGVVAYGPGGDSGADTDSVRIDTYVPAAGPGLSVGVAGSRANIEWSAPGNPGQATLTGWNIQLFRGATKIGDDDLSPSRVDGAYTGLPVGSYTVKITPKYTADDTSGIQSTSKSFVVAAKPSAPRIGAAVSGKKGKPVTAGVKWAAPRSTGGAAITGYKAVAYRLNKKGRVVATYVSRMLKPTARSFAGRLPAGRYKFRVVAYNRVGASPGSAYSKVAKAR